MRKTDESQAQRESLSVGFERNGGCLVFVKGVFFTFYYGKSPLNPPFREYLLFFSKHLKQILVVTGCEVGTFQTLKKKWAKMNRFFKGWLAGVLKGAKELGVSKIPLKRELRSYLQVSNHILVGIQFLPPPK